MLLGTLAFLIAGILGHSTLTTAISGIGIVADITAVLLNFRADRK